MTWKVIILLCFALQLFDFCASRGLPDVEGQQNAEEEWKYTEMECEYEITPQ